MSAVVLIAIANLKQSVRNRSFFVLAIVAPFVITAALASTIGSALTGMYQPDLVIADELGSGALDDLVVGLSDAGFDDIEIVDSGDAARSLVDDGEADAAIIYPAALGRSLADPTADPAPIVVVADAQADIAATVATAIAAQSGRSFDTIRTLGVLGAPADDLVGPLAVREQSAGVRVLTDGTYFAVGMTSYFAFFAATALMATIHRERRQSTLARMLGAPIPRFAPAVGKGVAAGIVALVSYTVLVVASSLLLGASWGPPVGVAVVGLALCFSAVGVSMALVSTCHSEESAGQIGAVVTTAWALFGGVFLPVPASGLIRQAAKLSPFSWVGDAIGINAGTGSLTEVLSHSAAIAAFGLVGGGFAYARRNHLVSL